MVKASQLMAVGFMALVLYSKNERFRNFVKDMIQHFKEWMNK